MSQAAFKPTHKVRPSPPIEAWQFTGQPKDEWPGWILEHYRINKLDPKPTLGRWALTDEVGDFWRWMDHREFTAQFVTVSSARGSADPALRWEGWPDPPPRNVS